MEDSISQNNVDNYMQNQAAAQQDRDQKSSSPEIEQMAAIITDLDRRLRVLEERYTNIRKKLQLTDQNILESERGFSKELKSINEDTLRLKKQVNDYSDKVYMFGDELNQTAKKTDLKVMEKYLILWDPKNFVTRKELKAYLQQRSRLKDTDMPPETE